MLIKMKTTSCSANGVMLANRDYDIETAEAAALISAGFAQSLEVVEVKSEELPKSKTKAQPVKED